MNKKKGMLKVVPEFWSCSLTKWEHERGPRLYRELETSKKSHQEHLVHGSASPLVYSGRTWPPSSGSF